jgi:hypothetical protein
MYLLRSQISAADKDDRDTFPRVFPCGQLQSFGVPAAVAGAGRIEPAFQTVHSYMRTPYALLDALKFVAGQSGNIGENVG